MLALVLTLVVAALHVGFMVLETFAWTTPKVRRSFGMSAEDAETTRVLAANQGVYNGALAAGVDRGADLARVRDRRGALRGVLREVDDLGRAGAAGGRGVGRGAARVRCARSREPVVIFCV